MRRPFVERVVGGRSEDCLKRALDCIYKEGVILASQDWGLDTADPERKPLGDKGGSEFEYWMRQMTVWHKELLARQAELVDAKAEIVMLGEELTILKAQLDSNVSALADVLGGDVSAQLEAVKAEKERSEIEVEEVKLSKEGLQDDLRALKLELESVQSEKKLAESQRNEARFEKKKLGRDLLCVEAVVKRLGGENETLRRDLAEVPSKII